MSAFLWALVAACFGGVAAVMEKVGLGGTSPFVGMMVRSVGVVIGVLVLGFIGAPWSGIRTLSWSSAILLVGGGFLGSVAGQLAFYHALKSSAVSQVAPVAGAFPLVAALLGWWLLREPLTVSRGLGMLCVVIGVMLLRK